MRWLYFCLLGWLPLPAATAPDVLPVDKVWAGHQVGFALLTAPPYQYAAYYDTNRQMTVAQRRLDRDKWVYQKLSTSVVWDSHNYVTLALDRTGQLHVSGNMHVVPLIYFRTTKAGDISTLAAAPMVGEREQRMTYPVFIKDKGGRLIYRYRDGQSGSGDDLYNVYDEASQKWSRLLTTPLTNGQGKMNAYCTTPLLGPDGMFHLCWVWRNTPDCSTNHDLSYAKSVDLVHWVDSASKELPLPITVASGEIVDPVPVKGGIINSNLGLGFDTRARVILTYHKYDANGDLQIYAARRDPEGWTIIQVSDWQGYRWEFSGGGTIDEEVSIGAVEPIGDGKLTLAYRYPNGAGTWILDDQTMQPIPDAKLAKKATLVPAGALKVASTFAGMKKRQASDLGAESTDFSYRLVWESLDANRDRARPPPWPEASELKVIKVKNR
ncbi:MAG: BNR repeat-containing protein [Verrucomicrobia bacterium]|nr:BNR repeat-containing protein [Verrucomicrobiota bacterium]